MGEHQGTRVAFKSTSNYGYSHAGSHPLPQAGETFQRRTRMQMPDEGPSANLREKPEIAV